jgi:hypothetical protein
MIRTRSWGDVARMIPFRGCCPGSLGATAFLRPSR